MNEAASIATPVGDGGQREFRRRFFWLKVFFALFFLAVGLRLFMIQVWDARTYQAMGRKQYEQKFILPATRGNIYDRNGNVLVSNTMFVSFVGDPRIIGDQAEEVATTFARIFGKNKSFYLERLSEPNKRFVWLERGVKPEVAKRIQAARLPGVVSRNEAKRIYHYDEVAGQLIGYTDIDNRGISGLELQLNEFLSGTNGSETMQRDGLGRVRASVDYPRVEPVNGRDVALTINLEFQAIVEEELRRGIEANKATGGLAVMVNPKTGEILAMSTVPSVNPNEFHANDPSVSRNRVISDLFEPGSVFKVVTASALYENKIVTPETKVYAEHGKMVVMVNGRKIRTVNDTHEYDWLTFQEAIELSSNIVMAKLSRQIGAERFFRTARAFGFGVPTGIDLPGEIRGKLRRPDQWSAISLQTMSYGYEVGVTPIQMLSAYAAVANGGVMMKPYVVSQVRDENGEAIAANHPEPVRRVISTETAQLLTNAFEGVVTRGTGMEVRANGVRIAGKTGTSRKFVDGKYESGSYTASFVGYFPSEDPQVACLVMMDNPKARGYYGGTTSGPVFSAIAQRVISTSSRFAGKTIAVKTAPESTSVAVPDVRMVPANLAQKMLEGYGLKSRVFGKGAVVMKQSPEAGKQVEPGDVISLVLNEESRVDAGGQIVVPDVRGMSVRRAMNRLMVDEFDVRVQGNGVVAQQFPIPGQRVKSGSSVTVVCGPRPLTQTALY